MLNIWNFPVLNEGNLIGLLRRLRRELANARSLAGKKFGIKEGELKLKYEKYQEKLLKDNI